MAEYSKIARGNFISEGVPQIITLPFQPTVVKLTNQTAFQEFAAGDIPWATWDVSLGQGTASVSYIAAGTPNALQIGIVTSAGISTFSQGISLQYGPALQISAIDRTTSVVTTASAHGYNSGDVVVLQGLRQSPTTGMPQIAGIPFSITVLSSTTFSIDWNLNQSNFTSLTGSPAGSTVKKVLNPYLYVPGGNVISDISASGPIAVITTTAAMNFVEGQEVAMRIPAAYGSIELNSLPNTMIPGSPIYGIVADVIADNQVAISLAPFGGSITAFNSNQPVSSVSGLQFPQIVAVGDINSGGWPYVGGDLYPSPVIDYGPFQASTINGPAIQGAFINNTRQGFIIGDGNAVVDGTPDTDSELCGGSGDVIYWEAMFTDFGS